MQQSGLKELIHPDTLDTRIQSTAFAILFNSDAKSVCVLAFRFWNVSCKYFLYCYSMLQNWWALEVCMGILTLYTLTMHQSMT